MPQLVAGMYPRIKVNSPVNLEPLSAKEPEYKNANQDATDYVSRVLGKKSNSAASNFKYTGTTPGVEKFSAKNDKPPFGTYDSDGENQASIWDVEKITANKPNEAMQEAYDVAKSKQYSWQVWADSTYQTSKDEDLSATYGTSIQRQDGFRGSGTDLGMDTLESRQKASKIIVEYKDTIIEMGEKYGVNPAILASVIFTEQACNVGKTEGFVDSLKSIFDVDTSVGIAQVALRTAIDMETNYMQEKIIYCGSRPDQTQLWKIPGQETLYHGPYKAAVLSRAKDPKNSIEYAAAYLANIRDLWKGEYPRIDGDTAISATIYNLGIGQTSPHDSPGTNDFGRYARANYYYMESLLGWSAK